MTDLRQQDADDADAGPLAGLQATERASAVRDVVLRLPARYREPIILYYFEEMNLAETTRILGIPEGTLKARLHRGKEFLRRRLLAAGLGGVTPLAEER